MERKQGQWRSSKIKHQRTHTLLLSLSLSLKRTSIFTFTNTHAHTHTSRTFEGVKKDAVEAVRFEVLREHGREAPQRMRPDGRRADVSNEELVPQDRFGEERRDVS